MTASMEFKNRSDLNAGLLDAAMGAPDAAALIGRWANTNSQTRGVAELSIEQEGGTFIVKIVGAGADGQIPWQLTQAQVFANLEEEGGQRSVALAAEFDFGFMKSDCGIRVNKGVLVILLFNTFRDESGRSDYVTREFFYRPN